MIRLCKDCIYCEIDPAGRFNVERYRCVHTENSRVCKVTGDVTYYDTPFVIRDRRDSFCGPLGKAFKRGE